MIFYQIGVLLMVVLITVLILSRLLRQYQLYQLKKTDPSPIFQKKIRYLEQRDRSRQANVLLGCMGAMALVAILLLLQVSLTQEQLKEDQLRMSRLEEQALQLKQQYFEAAAQIPISPYPAEGLGLTSYAWAELPDGDAADRFAIETGLSQQLIPYLGLTRIAIAKSSTEGGVELVVKGEVQNEKEQELLLSNMSHFFEDSLTIPQIEQVSFDFELPTKDGDRETFRKTYRRGEE